MKNSGYSSNTPGTVSGVFFTKKDADHAYHSLLRRGHTQDDISVLMSDETLSLHENQVDEEQMPTEKENLVEKAKEAFVTAIISVTSMILLPGIGVAISKTFLKKVRSTNSLEHASDEAVGAQILNSHTLSYGDSMKEGGIIISVDPKNAFEKAEIVEDFRRYNGHDILGDDGYTELD